MDRIYAGVAGTGLIAFGVALAAWGCKWERILGGILFLIGIYALCFGIFN